LSRGGADGETGVVDSNHATGSSGKISRQGKTEFVGTFLFSGRAGGTELLEGYKGSFLAVEECVDGQGDALLGDGSCRARRR
jgi:hypothetical protein